MGNPQTNRFDLPVVQKPIRRLTGGESRKVSTSIRFTVDEYLRIVRAAKRAHLSVSDYVRSRVPETSTNLRLRRDSNG